MKIIRFKDRNGNHGHGSLNPDGSVNRIAGPIFGAFNVTDEKVDVARMLAPIDPVIFLCIGLNYCQHAAETGAKIPQWPVLFIKNPAAVQNPGDPIVLPGKLKSNQVDHECELAVVIGKTCKNATKANALDYVLGYTCGNDISARDWQKDFGGTQWCRGKTFDTFAPLGPCIVTKDQIPNPNALSIGTKVNGVTVQQANTSDMIFDVPTLIEFLSGSTTLLPGTVILTGTPSGVGAAAKPPRWLKPGDVVEVEIEKIGKLVNPVVDET